MTTSHVVIVDDAASMPELMGTGDSILRELERAFPDVDILVRGNHISLTGDEVAVASCAAAIEELRAMLAAGVPLTPQVARESVRILRAGGTSAAGASPAAAEAPGSPAVAVLSRSILSSRGRTIRPRTQGQASYVNAIEGHTITFGIGPAGTGKTYLAMAQAVAALQAKRVNRIVLTRPAVEAGERLGFLPGTLSEKIDPYLRPLYDALHDMIDPESIPKLIEAGTIEVAPLAYMRGRTLNDAFVVLDEAQNTTREQMKMFLTRLGFGSTMVVTGDITQVDLPGGMESGLRAARDILRGVDDIAFCELTAEDVVRHRLVSDIITAYARADAVPRNAAGHARPRRQPASKPTEGQAE
jgi:phosphate starvation-inducible PhoH-like protein